ERAAQPDRAAWLRAELACPPVRPGLRRGAAPGAGRRARRARRAFPWHAARRRGQPGRGPGPRGSSPRRAGDPGGQDPRRARRGPGTTRPGRWRCTAWDRPGRDGLAAAVDSVRAFVPERGDAGCRPPRGRGDLACPGRAKSVILASLEAAPDDPVEDPQEIGIVVRALGDPRAFRPPGAAGRVPCDRVIGVGPAEAVVVESVVDVPAGPGIEAGGGPAHWLANDQPRDGTADESRRDNGDPSWLRHAPALRCGCQNRVCQAIQPEAPEEQGEQGAGQQHAGSLTPGQSVACPIWAKSWRHRDYLGQSVTSGDVACDLGIRYSRG